MKRGRRHGRSPHSKARAVACGSNVGRCPIYVGGGLPQTSAFTSKFCRLLDASQHLQVSGIAVVVNVGVLATVKGCACAASFMG